MPSEKLRPRQPLVAMPRTGSSARIDDAVGKAMAGAGDRRPHLAAGRKMDRDVAAIVDIGLVEIAHRHSIAAMISSATEPATAAIGVMNSRPRLLDGRLPCGSPSCLRTGVA